MDPDGGAWAGPLRSIMELGRTGASRDGSRIPRGSGPIETDPGANGSTLADPDERAIVAAVLGGDRDAFRRLVEREAPSVVRACHRIVGDHAEAEDAAQEAFVTAYRSLATWRADGPFGAWLTRIAVRIALRMVGRRRTVAWRDPGARDHDASDRTAADHAADRAAVSAAPWTDPAVLSMRAERATEIRAAVAALPEPYREVVALRFFAESSLEEIARQTGRPLGTVKTHLHRGLARLRAAMAEEDR